MGQSPRRFRPRPPKEPGSAAASSFLVWGGGGRFRVYIGLRVPFFFFFIFFIFFFWGGGGFVLGFRV